MQMLMNIFNIFHSLNWDVILYVVELSEAKCCSHVFVTRNSIFIPSFLKKKIGFLITSEQFLILQNSRKANDVRPGSGLTNTSALE